MTNSRRIFTIVKSLVLILIAVIMILYPDDGYLILLLLIDISLLIHGIRQLIYYFTMTRYKVGGLKTLYTSLIVTDLSILLFSIAGLPQRIVMTALILMLAFYGVVYVMKAMKSKKLESSSWKHQLLYGIFMFMLAILCAVFIDSIYVATIVFSFAIIVSAVSDLITAMKKTAIIYIG